MIVSKLEAEPLPLKGAFLLKPMQFVDERGLFYKLYTDEILKKMGVKPLFPEEYLSVSKKGVLRGLHFQKGEHAQAKLVRCMRGEIYDVIVDIRPESPTFSKWFGVRLSEKNMLGLYVPRGFAHSFLALEDESHVLYKADNDYAPNSEGGIRWDDPGLKIDWPVKKPMLSEKDAAWPTLKEMAQGKNI